MVSSKATTVDDYLAELPDARRAVIADVLALVRKHLPNGYEEVMAWGMVTWQVPLARCPDTYNGKPLALAALAAQKNHCALYLHCAYQDSAAEARLRQAYAQAGVRLDMGKSCLRFKRVADLLPAAVAEAIAATPVDAFVAQYRVARGGR